MKAFVLMVVLALVGCTAPAEEEYRPPLLVDLSWRDIVQVMGDFGPNGGAFEGSFEDARFQGFRYPAPDGASIRIELTRLSGRADPVLAIYGPQNEIGIWGEPIAKDDDGGGNENAAVEMRTLGRGTYLVVVSARETRAAGRYRLTLSCLAGCAGGGECELRDVCPADDVCFTGYLLDDAGCPTCECRDECRQNAECGPEESCRRGVCEELCTCDDPFDPVCGSDGFTYGNACEAGCEGARVVSEEPCAEVCIDPTCPNDCPFGRQRDDRGCETCACLSPCEACPGSLEPVCTWSGRSFGNACRAECEGERVAYAGVCRAACAPGACELACPNGYAQNDDGCPTCQCALEPCPAAIEPVCGSDGVTYRNACEADRAGAEVLFDSACPPGCSGPEDCPGPYDCRSGVLGLPDCDPAAADCPAACIAPPMDCANDSVIADTCLITDECVGGVCTSPCDCRPVWFPVCGEDGLTYDNACRARCAEVPVAHPGACCPSAGLACDVSCPNGFALDENGCELCECLPDDRCSCDDTVINRVCGADGKYYTNECFMRCAGVRPAENNLVCGPDSDDGG